MASLLLNNINDAKTVSRANSAVSCSDSLAATVILDWPNSGVQDNRQQILEKMEADKAALLATAQQSERQAPKASERRLSIDSNQRPKTPSSMKRRYSSPLAQTGNMSTIREGIIENLSGSKSKIRIAEKPDDRYVFMETPMTHEYQASSKMSGDHQLLQGSNLHAATLNSSAYDAPFSNPSTPPRSPPVNKHRRPYSDLLSDSNLLASTPYLFDSTIHKMREQEQLAYESRVNSSAALLDRVEKSYLATTSSSAAKQAKKPATVKMPLNNTAGGKAHKSYAKLKDSDVYQKKHIVHDSEVEDVLVK
jgi:hypothetical protein